MKLLNYSTKSKDLYFLYKTIALIEIPALDLHVECFEIQKKTSF